LAIYQDVLAVPTPEATSLDTKAASEAIRQAEMEQDRRILEGVEKRLLGGVSVTAEPGSVENQPSYRRILARAHEVVSRAEVARLRVDPNATIGTNPVPMTVLSIREFEALVRTSVRLPRRTFFFLLMLYIAATTLRYPSSGDRSRCYEGECDSIPKASYSQVNSEIQYPATFHLDYEIPQIIRCIRRHESGRRIHGEISNRFVKSLPTFFQTSKLLDN